jgi:hypothetical protein
MTTAKYLPAIEDLPEVAGEIYCDAMQLIGAGIGGCEIRSGDQIVRYSPVGQLVNHTGSVSLFATHARAANNDGKGRRSVASFAAMAEIMLELKAPGMPPWVRRLAEDWLRHQSDPGAAARGTQILRQVMQGQRGGLKIAHSNATPMPSQPRLSKSSRGAEKERKRQRELLLHYLLAA